MKKVIFNLSILVDETIHEYMRQFKVLGRKAKRHQSNKKPPAETIKTVHKQMASIYKNLGPFEQRVRELYPHMIELFDILTKIRKHDEKS